MQFFYSETLCSMSETEEQVALLLSLLNTSSGSLPRHKAALCVMYDTGCNVQELCDLIMSSIKCDGQSAKIIFYGKGSKRRILSVSDATASVIRSYIIEHRYEAPPEAYFLVSQSHHGFKHAGISHILKKYAETARNIDPNFPETVNCQMLRNSHAIHMLSHGGSLKTVRAKLGHYSSLSL